MPAGNRSPLGFLPILLFHLCVLATWVMLQNLSARFHPASGGGWVFYSLLAVGAAFAGVGIWAFRHFLWDTFRSFKSAAVVLTLLVLSCVMGTLVIQNLDLRRSSPPVYFSEGREFPRDGSLPPFDNRYASTRVALAEMSLLQWLLPDERRRTMLDDKVVLSPIEEKTVEEKALVFGDGRAEAFKKAILASKRRNVVQITTSLAAKEHYGALHGFFKIAHRLHLFDIFESWWFYALLALIGINVIIGTIARGPWNVRDFGVAVTHAGIITILTGALWDRLVAEEGYIYFKYSGRPGDQVKSVITDQKNQTYTHLPFRVRMDRFATEYYHELLVRRIDWTRRHDGQPWDAEHSTPFSVWEQMPIRAGVGRVFEASQPEELQLRVNVTRYRPRVQVRTTVTEREGGELDPALKLGLYPDPMGSRDLFAQYNEQPWLFAMSRDRATFPFFRHHFEYVWARDKAEYDRLLRTPPIPDNGSLVIRSGGETVTLPVALGDTWRGSVGPKVMTVRFLDVDTALLDGEENVNLDRGLQRREEPVLYLQVDDHQVLVPRDDAEFFDDEGVLGASFRFDWPDPKDSGVRGIIRIVEGDGLDRTLVQHDGVGGVLATPLVQGRPVGLTGEFEGAFLGVEQWVSSAEEGREVRDVSDEAFLARGGDEDHQLAAAMDLEIIGPWGEHIVKDVTPFDPPIFYGEDPNVPGRPRYVFQLVRTQQARDWFSVLSVLDHDDRVVKTHTVQVNSPLRHQGYRFFQATVGQDEGFDVSGISVTFQPGVLYMYIGYAVLTSGVCWIFFLRPVIVSRWRRRQRAEAAA